MKRIFLGNRLTLTLDENKSDRLWQVGYAIAHPTPATVGDIYYIS
ncbi:hypothetical protein [Nostoc sp. FACHB-892]|nr:hypothetical protein [Nostoc sp. FACHB-892]